jgi:predicted ATPase
MFVYGCGEYNNQYILETHSEHLMLRLLRRVREGKIPPEMLSVIYVSRGPFGSVVHSVRIDKNGDFMDDFPGGFFPERLDELL